jgi:hypothetical protein
LHGELGPSLAPRHLHRRRDTEVHPTRRTNKDGRGSCAKTCLRCAADTHEPRTTRHVERDLSGRSKQCHRNISSPQSILNLGTHPAAINTSPHVPPWCGLRRTSAAGPHTP